MRGVVGVVAVAAQVFSEEQLGQLRSFPDIGRDDLIRYFTLTQADVAFVMRMLREHDEETAAAVSAS